MSWFPCNLPQAVLTPEPSINALHITRRFCSAILYGTIGVTLERNPYANTNPDQVIALWQACHNGMAERWDPTLADGMSWEEFDERSKTMSISAYLSYETRQAPMFSEREDQIIADAFGADFAQKLKDIHEREYDHSLKAKRQGRLSKFLGKLISR